MARAISPIICCRFLALLFLLLVATMAARAQRGEPWGGLSFTGGRNGNSIAIGIYGQVTPRYMFGANLLDVTWVGVDPYNPGSHDVSYLTFVNTGALFVMAIFSGGMGSCAPEPSLAWKCVALPLVISGVLINSEHHYIFYGGDGDSQFRLSMFLKTKFDYYGEHNVSWARWAPGGGLGLTGNIKPSPTSRLLLKADLGVDKPIDLVHGGVTIADWRPTVSLGVYFQ